MSQSILNLAVIGCGRIGRLHAENIATRLRGARLAGVADLNLAAARELAERFQVPLVSADYRTVLEAAAVEAVVICSATDTHVRLLEEAAAAGKHVFCEKPIGLDVAPVRRALSAVERTGVKLQVGFNRRFDPSFAKVRELVAAGRIGRPHLIRITSRDPAPPPLDYVKVSGGLFLDMTIHDFDMVRFLSGSEAEEVFAVGQALVDPAIGRAGDVDTAVVTLRLTNGALATIDNSRRAVYGYDQRLEVFGSDGLAAAGNRTPDSHLWLNADGAHAAKPHYFFLDRYQESYVAELQAFVDCVANDQPPPVTGHDGLAPVLMGLAATRSLREGRPVKLAEVS